MGKRYSPAHVVKAFIIGVSIRTKFMAIVLTVVFILSSVAVVHTRIVVARVVGKQLDERTISVANGLARRSQDSVLTNDTYALYQLVRDMTQSDSDIRYAFIVGPSGDILAHTFDEGVPRDLLRLNLDVSKGANLMKIQTEEGVIRDAVAPIDSAAGSIVKVGVTEKLLNESVASSTRTLVVSALITSVSVLLLSYIVTLLFVRPILDLRKAARALGDGYFGSRARVWWNDEIGYLARNFNDMAVKLQEFYASIRENEEARTRLLQKIISAQEDERRRIARELHDETSQSLASVNIALSTILDGNDAKRRVQDLQVTIFQALERIRNLAFDLRPGLLDDLGLVAATDRYVEGFRERYGLAVDFQSIGMDGRRLKPEVETAVYRIVQEALVNAAKHARANHVSVVMELNHRSLHVLIEDDGQGFAGTDQPRRSLGLFGMQERIALIGGTLRIDSAPGEGAAVVLDVPLGD